MALLDVLMSRRIVAPNGCWCWSGRPASNGYAYIQTQPHGPGTRRVALLAHRVSFELFVGSIPKGLELDHKCRVPQCFNPSHLEPVTRRENTMRGLGPSKLGTLNGSKTHCQHGHPFDEANTAIRRGGGRRCRACDRERPQRKLQASKAAERKVDKLLAELDGSSAQGRLL